MGISFLIYAILRDMRLPPRSRRELRSSGLLRSEQWRYLTEVSGQPIGPNLKVQQSKMKA